jgi:D-alanyl-lipoteichoic acid acyltransferase DltB (MBOAT superfamily)
MLFNSYVFLFAFLPLTWAGFFLIGGRGHHRAAISWLVGSSLFFYGWWNPAYLGLILFSILFNYAVGARLSFFQQSGKPRRGLLAFGVATNLGLLAYFKYANFFVDTINYTLGVDWELENIVLPLAISFFTFQQIAYLVDAHRGETHEYNFLHYCLFVTFFPQLIAGPIVHHREMLPQFENRKLYRINWENLAVGLSILVIGLFKKVVIADNIASYATPVFTAADSGQELSFFLAWQGTIAYTLQLYFDFSGYSDMAIGLARMFGVRLPLNFNSPYRANNIIDFWRRWHMTLSRFLRDYLYVPLGGNRKGKPRRYVNLMMTMVLGGLWHGAGWTFVAWGALHGAYLMANHGWRAIFGKPRNRWWAKLVARSVTLLAVMVAWVFFRAETFDGALSILSSMTHLPDGMATALGPLAAPLSSLGVRFDGGLFHEEHRRLLLWAVFWLAVIWGWPNTQQLFARYRPAIDFVLAYDTPTVLQRWTDLRWRPSYTWAVALGCLSVLCILSLAEISEFLYFQF